MHSKYVKDASLEGEELIVLRKENQDLMMEDDIVKTSGNNYGTKNLKSNWKRKN